MKRLIIIVVLSMISNLCKSQDFVFDQKMHRMNIPIVKSGTQWEIGSCCLRVILQNDNQKADTIFNSIGCSQYKLEVTEESADLKIYLWPFYFYNTDCALEDDIRPEKDEYDLLIHYSFYKKNITVNIKWNIEKYTNDSIYSSIAFDSFDFNYLSSVFSLIQQGQQDDVIDSLLSKNEEKESDNIEFMYRNDVLINLLPLNNKTLTSSDIYILKDCFGRLHKKYTR